MNNIELMSHAYYKLLTSIDWNDEVFLCGMREGLNKFLSNISLKLNSKNKYLQGDFYSINAIKQIKEKRYSNLIYEHMIPKNKYIQRPCEEKAREGNLTIDIILELLNKYWKIAIITSDENKLLHQKTMPIDWDNENIFYRYEHAGIKLVKSSSDQIIFHVTPENPEHLCQKRN